MGRRLAVSGRGARGDRRALITRGAITRIADRDGVSAPVVERDYILTHIVEALAQLEPPPGLVFKGGTAVRLCFYEDYRYSADLDFSLVELTVDAGLSAIRRALEQCVKAVALPRLSINGGYQNIAAIDILLTGAPSALLKHGRRVVAA